jgi:hypothetical protein
MEENCFREYCDVPMIGEVGSSTVEVTGKDEGLLVTRSTSGPAFPIIRIQSDPILHGEQPPIRERMICFRCLSMFVSC